MASPRWIALDALRGLTIAAMILVNYAGPLAGAPWPLRHSAWHGCTPTDLVFPMFLFIVGVAIWFRAPQPAHALRRAAWLFAVGLFINAFPFVGVDYAHVTIMGVLQRIALCYAIAALVCPRVPRAALVALAAGILLGYWALLAFGSPDPYSIDASLPGRVDRALFGAAHLNPDYSPPFDPEGLLGTLPALANVIAGYLAGAWLSRAGAHRMRAIGGLVAAAAPLVALARVWDLVLPINKPLWTSSFALYTIGLALATLALAMWIVDVRGWRPARAIAFGKHPLAVYVTATLVKGAITYFAIHAWLHAEVAGVLGAPVAAVAIALAWVALFSLLARQLERRQARRAIEARNADERDRDRVQRVVDDAEPERGIGADPERA
jgi:predicted acyltransferase